MKITKFDRSNLNLVRSAIDNKLAELKEELNMDLSIGAISFSDNQFTTKLTVNILGEEGENIQNVKDFENMKIYRGDINFDLGDTFVDPYNGHKFEVIGCFPKSRKNCIKIKNVRTEKVFKCSPDYISIRIK